MFDLLFKLAGAVVYRVVHEYRKIEDAGGDVVRSLGIAADDDIATDDDEDPDDETPRIGFTGQVRPR
jgi:hypothetical protein